MADERLQQLRRAWDEGDLEAQVRLLRERMRAGELSEERVQLATLCGSGLAARITGHDCDSSMAPCFRCWDELSILNRLDELGGDAASVRAAIAGSWLVHRHWQRLWEREDWEGLSAHAWRTHHPRPPGLTLAGDWSELSGLVASALSAAESQAAAGLRGEPAPAGRRAREQLREWSQGTGFDLRWTTFPLDLALGGGRRGRLPEPDWVCLSYGVAREDLLNAIRDELVPWALGLLAPGKAWTEGTS